MDLTDYMAHIITVIREETNDEPGRVITSKQTQHANDKIGAFSTEFDVNPYSQQPENLKLTLKREVTQNMLGKGRINEFLSLIPNPNYAELEGIIADEANEFSAIIITPLKHLKYFAWVTGNPQALEILSLGNINTNKYTGRKILLGDKYFQDPYSMIKSALDKKYSIIYEQGNGETGCRIAIFQGADGVTSNHLMYNGPINAHVIDLMNTLIPQMLWQAQELKDVAVEYNNWERTPNGPVLSDRTKTIKINPQIKYQRRTIS